MQMKSRDLAAEYIAKCEEIIKHDTIEALSYLGEQCVKRVRDRSPKDSWNDQTGNLRSSIGYMVLYNGQPVQRGGFIPTTNAPKGDGSKGRSDGEKFLQETVAEVARDNSFALVIVAGMNYADKVEALENKDVLASTQLWADNQWPTIEKNLQKRIENDINKIQLIM